MAEIMTREYCVKCPWFDSKLGYLEADDPYWQSHQSACACEDCPGRKECEEAGPKNVVDCILYTITQKCGQQGRNPDKILEILKKGAAKYSFEGQR